MLHFKPNNIAEAHQLRPVAPEGEVLIRFDGRKRDGLDPEIFAVIPLSGLAQASTRLLAKFEAIITNPSDDEAPQFRQTHGGPAIYLPLERDETEGVFAEFIETVPSRTFTPDLFLLLGKDGMGNFPPDAAFESPGNEFPVIDEDVALDMLLVERSRQIRASIGLISKDRDIDNDGPSLS